MTGSFPLFKLAVHIISAVSLHKVVQEVIRNNTTVVSTMDAARVMVGTLVVESMIADVAAKHVNERVEEGIAWFQKRKEEAEKNRPPNQQ